MPGKTRIKHIPESGLGNGVPWTSIGPGSLVKGDLLMAGNVMIYGRVEGLVFTDGEVWVCTDGHVEGGIHASRVTVEGRCHGRIEAHHRVELKPGSEVHAEIATPQLDVQGGARHLGRHLHSARKPGPEAKQYRGRSLGNA